MKVIYPDVEFNAKLDSLVSLINSKLADYYAKNFSNLAAPKVVPDPGFKYVKLVNHEHGIPSSVYGFVDKADGAIYMAAGWKKPSLNGARGNIYDEDNGIGACGPHGIKYKGVASRVW